jgi:hypothetical protein
MSRFTLASLAAALVGAAWVGCSGQSPVSPTGLSGDAAARAGGAPAPAGIYQLSFNVVRLGVLEPVLTLPVSSEEMILRAFVTDSSGVPVQTGAVTFEYCSYKGGPPNDITRADEAPKEACLTPSATWARLSTVKVDAGSCPRLGVGNACRFFGIVRIPRDVGFRFRYAAQRSGIADGVSQPVNFTWTAAP